MNQKLCNLKKVLFIMIIFSLFLSTSGCLEKENLSDDILLEDEEVNSVNDTIEEEQTVKNSFVFFEWTYNHIGRYRLYDTWDFMTKMVMKPNIDVDWTSPINYKDGTYDFEVEVIEMEEVTEEISIQFGWWNDKNDPEIKHIASHKLFFDKPGSYSYSGKLKDLRAYFGAGARADQRAEMYWDWTNAYATNTFYTIINPNGNKEPNEGFPIRVHVKLTIHEADK